MVKQIPTAVFPGKNTTPQATEPLVDPQRRITDNWRRWTEFVDTTVRRFAGFFTFLKLEDTPDSYSGQTLKVVRVKADESGLEFATASAFTAASTTEQLTGTDATKGSTPDSVAALWEKGADVASASPLVLGEGGFFHITGTVTISDIDFGTDKSGRKVWLEFDGVLQLTHHATTLILPTGANITTAAGDTACFISEGSDAVRCVSYQRKDGTALTAGSSGISELTGDVTAGPGSGSQSATIPNDTVTYAKMQNVSATSRVLGRKTSGAGDTEELTLSELLDFIGSAAQGDVLYRGSSAWARLAAGTAGYVLQTNGSSANPSWVAPSGIAAAGKVGYGFPNGNGAGAATETWTAGFMGGLSIVLPKGATIDRIGVNGGAANASTTWRVAVYSDTTLSVNALQQQSNVVTGIVKGLNIADLTTAYTNSSGADQTVWLIFAAATSNFTICDASEKCENRYWNQGSTTFPSTAPAQSARVGTSWQIFAIGSPGT